MIMPYRGSEDPPALRHRGISRAVAAHSLYRQRLPCHPRLVVEVIPEARCGNVPDRPVVGAQNDGLKVLACARRLGDVRSSAGCARLTVGVQNAQPEAAMVQLEVPVRNRSPDR